jgi:hypothetical protein
MGRAYLIDNPNSARMRSLIFRLLLPGEITISWNDLKPIVDGQVLVIYGVGRGLNRVEEACDELVVASSVYKTEKSVSRMVFYIRGSKDLLMSEVKDMVDRIKTEIHPAIDAFGVATKFQYEDEINVTLVLSYKNDFLNQNYLLSNTGELAPGRTHMDGIEIHVGDVRRNEQINIAALCTGLQTVIVGFRHYYPWQLGRYYALEPQKYESQFYKPNQPGEVYQAASQRGWGDKFQYFPRVYVGKLFGWTYNDQSEAFWDDMKTEGLFKYWGLKQGPMNFNKIWMIRVFEVDCNLRPYLIQTNKGRHDMKWNGPKLLCHGRPVIDDLQMKRQFEKLNEVLSRHNTPPAHGPYWE